MKEAVQLLKDLLAIPSVNGRDDEGKMAEYLCEYFKAAGLASFVQRLDETHANVIAVLEGGEENPPVLWNGHLDTVPYGERAEWESDPAVPAERDGFLYARGASDMKSGLAAMVYALCACKKSGARVPRTIRFIGTCDEEKNGLGARGILKEGLLGSAAELLIGEPTGCRMGVAQKGCLWLEMEVSGRTSHGAYPEEGCNAVEEAAALAGDIRDYVTSYIHPVLGASTAQITQIQGGVAPNMTPDACTLLMDIRMVPGLTKDMILAEAKRLAEERGRLAKGLFRAEFHVKNDRRAIETAPEHSFAERLSRCIEKNGLKTELTGINYFTDASILAADAPEKAVLLFGPGEPGMAHKPNERVELARYEKAIEILMDFIAAGEVPFENNDQRHCS